MRPICALAILFVMNSLLCEYANINSSFSEIPTLWFIGILSAFIGTSS